MSSFTTNDPKCNMFYQQALTLCTVAVEADDNNQREKAIAHYAAASDYFVAGYRLDDNQSRRAVILSRVHSFVGRAETLKTSLRTRSAPTPTTATTNSRKRPRASTSTTTSSSSSSTTTTFHDVIGLRQAKQSLIESIILPQKQPQLFTGSRKPFSGILLYGPPGTGKTLLAQAVANESDTTTTFITISASDIMSKYQGESERALKEIFDRARQSSPCIIFIDEVDSLGRVRQANEKAATRRIKTELLMQMDGLGKGNNAGVVVIGATNTPWELDPALRRRFQKRIMTPLPNAAERNQLLQLYLDGETDLSPHDFDRISQATAHYSSSDISILAREALMVPVRHCLRATHFKQLRNGSVVPCSDNDQQGRRLNIWSEDFDPRRLAAPKVTTRDMQEALKNSKSSVGVDDLEKCLLFNREFGEGVQQGSGRHPVGKVKGNSRSNSNSSSSSSSSGGVVNFFKGLFGFGNVSELPVAPTAMTGARTSHVVETEASVGERKAVAM